jgi:hypothetical protein
MMTAEMGLFFYGMIFGLIFGFGFAMAMEEVRILRIMRKLTKGERDV